MESKDDNFDSKDNFKVTDFNGNNIWCSNLGFRCLACCNFFEDDTEVFHHNACDHYICHICEMPIRNNNFYVGDDNEENFCYICIMIKNMEKMKKKETKQ